MLQENQFSSSIVTEAIPSFRFSRRQSIALVIGCTLVGAAAQILIKWGANGLVTSSPWAMLSNPPLVAGYCLYAVSTVLLVLALRDGELSVMYPIISMTYGSSGKWGGGNVVRRFPDPKSGSPFACQYSRLQ